MSRIVLGIKRKERWGQALTEEYQPSPGPYPVHEAQAIQAQVVNLSFGYALFR